MVRSGPLTDMKARAAAHKAVEVLIVYGFVQFGRERELVEISVYRKEDLMSDVLSGSCIKRAYLTDRGWIESEITQCNCFAKAQI